jgi:hypothetical protein
MNVKLDPDGKPFGLCVPDRNHRPGNELLFEQERKDFLTIISAVALGAQIAGMLSKSLNLKGNHDERSNAKAHGESRSRCMGKLSLDVETA